ncbi:unannotated protein [freshwater metagenome]|uniref:Unannotated protein n=1 Tax=freshwater metagenome TaxID=449393 RepID=A0A6J6LR69_9ZZZZ
MFSLTSQGRAALNQEYDSLAIDALEFVAQTQGTDGIIAFAEQRAKKLMVQLEPSATTTELAVEQLAQTLTTAGYAASVEKTSDGGYAVQLCQHHCPVIDAATHFPELCEAETKALGDALGLHVTRLATLAHGDGVCTTVIPLVQRKALA